MLVIFDWELCGILDSEREVGGWKRVTTLIRTATTRRVGGQEREREREREREKERERASASDARGENSLGQGREVLTSVNGRGAELCA